MICVSYRGSQETIAKLPTEELLDRFLKEVEEEAEKNKEA